MFFSQTSFVLRDIHLAGIKEYGEDIDTFSTVSLLECDLVAEECWCGAVFHSKPVTLQGVPYKPFIEHFTLIHDNARPHIAQITFMY